MAKYDVSAFIEASPFYEQKIIDETGTASSIWLTGTKKLAQRFILELMTVQGSIPYRMQRGTSFVGDLRAGLFNTEIDVYAAFSAAMLTIKTNFNQEDTADDPSDEILDTAEIIALTISTGSVSMGVRLTTVAGTTLDISIPVQFDLSNIGN